MTSNSNSNEFNLPLSDIWLLCKRAWLSVLLASLATTSFCAWWTLSKPTRYIAIATFREKERSSAGLSSSFMDIFGTSRGRNSEAATVMVSRSQMEEIVRQHHLQARLSRQSDGLSAWQVAWHNLLTEWAILMKAKKPLFTSPAPALNVTDVCVFSELPIPLAVQFEDEEHFSIYNRDGELLATSALGEIVTIPNASFCLQRLTSEILEGERYSLSLYPLEVVATTLSKKLKVLPDEDDRTLLNLEISDSDRLRAAAILNDVMTAYCDYQRKQAQAKTDVQLAYLLKRQEEGRAYLQELMQEHAHTLSENLSHLGMVDAEKEMTFLAQTQNEHQRRLMEIDLELKRLIQADGAQLVVYDRYTRCADPEIINGILASIRSLRGQRDSLELALHVRNTNPGELTLGEQIKQIQALDTQMEELSVAIGCLQRDQVPPESLHLPCVAQDWLHQWRSQLQASLETTEPPKVQGAGPLLSYLENILRLCQIQKESFQERLIHTQNPSEEFSGIDLETAKNLSKQFLNKLAEVQSSQRQYQFVHQQLQDPDVELSTLSSVLSDPISRDMIGKAYEIQADLQDDLNRSQKEQQRLRQGLLLIRDFLGKHVMQTMGVLGENAALLEDKLHCLQGVSLNLIHQQISLKEKQLSDYVKQRTEDLQTEKGLLRERMQEIADDMALLPQKWVSEKLVHQQMIQNQKVVEEIARLVESKNLTHNLEVIQSSPLDRSLPPILPASPRFLFLSSVGLIFGAVMGLCWVLFWGLIRGLPASVAGLEMAGERVFGSLSTVADYTNADTLSTKDLQTLRRMGGFFELGQGPKRAVILESRGPHFTPHLAELLSRRGEKVISVNLEFNLAAEPRDLPGLLQFLNGEVPAPKIQAKGLHWTIQTGGMSRYGMELLGRPAFEELLERLEQDYDWVLLYCRQPLSSAEAEGACRLASQTIISVPNTTIETLRPFRKMGPSQRVGYVFQNS